VGGYGSLAQNLPASVSTGEIDDGGGQAAACWPAIDDQGYTVAELIAHARGIGTLGRALQVGGCGGNRQPEGIGDSARDDGVRDTERYVAGVGGDAYLCPNDR